MHDRLRPFRDSLADRYEFRRELGRGGMSIVWLALERRHGRQVAVKFLRPEIAQLVGDERFVQEIRIAADLNHPNILPLLDSGVASAAGGDLRLPFYAMPYVAGPSLESRLAERGPMAVEEVTEVTAQVAAALDYAHAQGIVHRDIKPGNILFSAGIAVVADFGIARAMNQAAGDHDRTTTGFAIGTAHYISPEQARGDAAIDGRADQYSLGCVVFEMLTGKPPFTGESPLAIMARHQSEPPPPIVPARPELPDSLEPVIQRVMAKDPVGRFGSAGAFAGALLQAVTQPGSVGGLGGGQSRRPARRRALAFGAVLLAAVVVAALLARDAPALDPDLFAVLDLDPVGTEVPLADELTLALGRWRGARVVAPPAPSGALEPTGTDGDLAPAVRRLAERSRAGLVLTADRRSAADPAAVTLSLWDTRTGSLLGMSGPLSLAAPAHQLRPHLERRVDEVIRAQFPAPNGCGWPRTPVHLHTLRAQGRGDSLLTAWDLGAADTWFRAALDSQANLVPALLCGALVRSWVAPESPDWQTYLLRLPDSLPDVSARDRRLAEALRWRAQDDLQRACDTWRDLAQDHALDFVVQYGLADCLVNDHTVLVDRRSPTGWRFRAELGEARRAFRRAAALNPWVYRDLRVGRATSGRRLFDSRPAALRPGREPVSRTAFRARAVVLADTLAYFPVPDVTMAAGFDELSPTGASQEAADSRVHAQLHDLILQWRSSLPEDVEARLAHAEALEIRGDRSALDTLRAARRVMRDPVGAYRAAAAEVFLLVRMGAPDEPALLERARTLADSLLDQAAASAQPPAERAALAALRGRTLEAADAWASPAIAEQIRVPPYLRGIAPRLLVFSAMGGPRDSLVHLAQLVERAIARQFAEADPRSERLNWLARAATLAWPGHMIVGIDDLYQQGDPVLDAVFAVQAADSAAARRALTPYWEASSRRQRHVLTLDAVSTEAQLRWQAGERERARTVLDDTLGALFGLGPGGLEDPLQAAGLVRAADMRARIARISGEAGLATRWQAVTTVLWDRPVSAAPRAPAPPADRLPTTRS